MHVRWLTAFLDFPATEFGPEVTFWRAITGSTVSPPRGEFREFASLDPFSGDSHLRVQRVADGDGGTHLDVHVDDPVAATLEAAALGARVLAEYPTHRVLESPAGGIFCLVPWSGEATRPRPIRWPGGTISIVDRVCFSVPAAAFDREVAFWSTLTGRPAADTEAAPSAALTRDPALPLQVLLLRGAEASPLSGWLDVAATDIDEEVERHEDWGATVTERHADHVDMADPIGRRYTVSDRSPRTGS